MIRKSLLQVMEEISWQGVNTPGEGWLPGLQSDLLLPAGYCEFPKTYSNLPSDVLLSPRGPVLFFLNLQGAQQVVAHLPAGDRLGTETLSWEVLLCLYLKSKSHSLGQLVSFRFLAV